MLLLIFVTFSWESVDAFSTVFLHLKPCMSFPCSVKYYIIKHFLLSLTFKFYPEWLGSHHMLCSLSVGGRNNPAFCAGGYSSLRLLHPVQLAPEIKLCLFPYHFLTGVPSHTERCASGIFGVSIPGCLWPWILRGAFCMGSWKNEVPLSLF